MSRYYNIKDNQRESNGHKNTLANRIVLPEFIPFEDGNSRDINIPQQASSSSNREESRSPNRSRNADRSTGDHRRASRDSYRSSNKSNSPQRASNYPARHSRSQSNRHRHVDRSRSRSRSPQISRARLHQPILYSNEDCNRDNDRSSSNGPRNGSSVFDRISSPPRRIIRMGEERRLDESGRSQHQLFRTVNTSTAVAMHTRHFEDPNFPNRELLPDVNPRFQLQGNDSLDVPRRSLFNQIDLTSHEMNESRTSSREAIEMRNYEQRLMAAENHCLGLEDTVRSYEREILKLRQIVRDLWDDFQAIQSRFR